MKLIRKKENEKVKMLEIVKYKILKYIKMLRKEKHQLEANYSGL